MLERSGRTQFLLQRLDLDFSVAPAELKSVERLKVFQNRLVHKLQHRRELQIALACKSFQL